MLRPEHPEVLARDWTPPVLVGRSRSLDELRRHLLVPHSSGGRPETAMVQGPAGSGTSAVARRAALDVIERLRQTGEPLPPVFAPVRVHGASGPQAIASELLQRFDPDFSAHGFPVSQIVAGFLRRLARSGRAAVVVLDDLGADCPDLGPILRPLSAPERFLPEGLEVAPRIWLILAGSDGAQACWRKAKAAGAVAERTVVLPPYSPAELGEIVRDRARRALGREVPPGWVERIGSEAAVHGAGAQRAMQLLRRQILGSGPFVPGSPYAEPSEAIRLAVEPRLLEALERAALQGTTFVRDVRVWEARLARAEGVRPLPTTTLWRRIVRLEAAGVLRREVRTGGSGGTQSRLELVRSGPPPRASTVPRGTLRGVGSSFGLAPL